MIKHTSRIPADYHQSRAFLLANKMVGYKTIAAAAFLAQGALGEGIHLFDCRSIVGDGVTKTWQSVVAVRGQHLNQPNHTISKYQESKPLYRT